MGPGPSQRLTKLHCSWFWNNVMKSKPIISIINSGKPKKNHTHTHTHVYAHVNSKNVTVQNEPRMVATLVAQLECYKIFFYNFLSPQNYGCDMFGATAVLLRKARFKWRNFIHPHVFHCYKNMFTANFFPKIFRNIALRSFTLLFNTSQISILHVFFLFLHWVSSGHDEQNCFSFFYENKIL